MKAGFVALVGRPNAGKSTLLNRLVGEKVAIVSDKPQTTRHRIVGVRNAPGRQFVFVDTPGIHKPLHRMNRRMVDVALDALKQSDVVVLVVDATGRAGGGDAFVVDLCARAGVRPIVALNKIDRVARTQLLPLMAHYDGALDCRAIVPISALTGDGVETLESEVANALPEGDPLYPEDYLTDQTVRSMSAEMIREKVLQHTRDELPYTTAVTIDQFEEPATPGGLTRIFASILVDNESQKPIVIGKGGDMIKRIGTEARQDLERLLDGRVHLDLHVKVRQDWRDDERLLDEMGLRKR
ncbi:MAG TPA: GTPase Era [Vicinamibacterales bacterium]|nr:GTPase Era [Vicinamibacterales bacterium]